MTRTLARGLFLSVALALAGYTGCDGRPAAGPAPFSCADCNVVLLSVDTLRADHLGAFGYSDAKTPNMDALAARSVVFENAISQSSWTRPAHMSIFTGLFPREHGFVALADTKRLEDGIPMLAEVMKAHGFRTAAFTGGVNLAAHYGFDRGFDVYRTNGKNFRDNLEDVRWWLDHEATPGKGRFFLFLHGYDAHTPYQTDPVDRRDMALPEKPPTASLGETCRAGGDRSRVAPFVREYDGAIHRADRYVGKLLAELETRGLTKNTIVVLLSDHGEEFLEHDRCFHVATVYREVLHVPLMISAPGLPPRRVKEPVSASVTIAPTILELAGVHDHPFREPSLAGAAAGGRVPDSPIVSETERNAPNKGDGNVRSLTTEDAKLVQYTTKGRSTLYDTRKDPAEQSPVYDAAKIASLEARLEAWAKAHEPKGPSRRKAGGPRSSGQGGRHGDDGHDENDPQQIEREKELRSLGYAD